MHLGRSLRRPWSTAHAAMAVCKPNLAQGGHIPLFDSCNVKEFTTGACGSATQQEEGGGLGDRTRVTRHRNTNDDRFTLEAVDHVQLAMPRGAEDQARRFYVGVLHMREEQKPSNLAKRGGCWFATLAVRLHLGVEDDFRPAKKAHPALRVNGLAQFRQHLETAGIATRTDEPLEGFERFYADDPFGNRIEFLEPVTR